MVHVPVLRAIVEFVGEDRPTVKVLSPTVVLPMIVTLTGIDEVPAANVRVPDVDV